MTNRTIHRVPLRLALSLSLALLILIGCAPAAAPTPTASPITQPPRFVTVIVTRTPTPTPAPTLTPTLPFDLSGALGPWTLDLTYTFRDGGTVRDLRYIGVASVNVGNDGTIFGTIELFGTVFQPPCNPSVLDAEPQRAAVLGSLRAADDGSLVGALFLRPADPLQVSSVQILCPGFTEALILREPILWPALEAVNALSMEIPMRPGATRSAVFDLTLPTSGQYAGTLTVTVRLGR